MGTMRTEGETNEKRVKSMPSKEKKEVPAGAGEVSTVRGEYYV